MSIDSSGGGKILSDEEKSELILSREDLANLDSKECITFLFGYKQRVLSEVQKPDDYNGERQQAVAQFLYEQRAEIAEVFRTFGREPHIESVRIFENLVSAEDLKKVPVKIKKKQEHPQNYRERLYHVPGFYVVVPRDEYEDYWTGDKSYPKSFLTSIRHSLAQEYQGLKTGDPIYLSIHSLVGVSDDNDLLNNKRPIFIDSSVLNEHQIKFLIQIFPHYAGRLKFTSVIDDELHISDSEEVDALMGNALSANVNSQVSLLREYVNHIPVVGEIYNGKISSVRDFGIFVEYFPGKDGLIHSSHLAKPVDDYVTGEEVVVEFMKIDQDNRVQLSEKNAQKRLNNNEFPKFHYLGGSPLRLMDSMTAPVIKK